MSNISRLPKISDNFLNHIKDCTLEKNEWMPCPRCGEGTVEPPSGAAAGGCAGASMIGCWILCIAIIAIILAVFFWPAAIIVGIVGLICIPVLPAMGAALGMMYKCKSCNYDWTFKDVEEYKKSKL